MKIFNPATGAIVRDVPVDAPKLVREKYDRARAAQPRWAAQSIRKRIDAVTRFRRAVKYSTGRSTAPR